ncbi:hypothetical protein D3D02_01695 [Halobellus sp. Atlit-38R]|uniref:DUF7527 domain-containing protein n=1 Tax=Halobellus sp. Atlit-38R TaxID=2282131 RepID=UPI000EF1F35E|nr:hypothetical protein [Halobellus sp. Atlit-38R]RLM94725.1 hypothetical protein D3D02_01695 [Halobellus sp. Atlit-38R]
MNSRTIDVVTDWETVATPDGYEGLHELADAEFTGAVSAGMAWAFFLNGRVVGVFEGEIGDFEDAELTAYRAADPSLPLLFSMQERGGETQARYYTNKTPLSDADQTLSNGGFTGYIELSENVLSGDYYVVYHGGKSMSAAFVGSSERLVTGEEAFETAADEVGIYEVVDVDVEIVDIPELATDEAETAEDDASSAEDGASEATEDATETADDATAAADDEEPTATADPDAAATPGSAAEATADDPTAAGEASTADTPTADDAQTDDGSGGGPATADAEASEPSDAPRGGDPASTDSPGATAPEGRTADSTEAEGETSAADEHATDTGSRATRPDDRQPSEPSSETASGAGDTGDATVAGPTQKGAAADGVFSDEERWREAKTIPSLDPSESSSNGTTAQAAGAEQDRRSAGERAAQMERKRTAQKAARGRSSASETADSAPTTQASTRSAAEGEQPNVERLEKRLSKAKERVQSLESERDELAEARTKQREQIDELEAEREEYRERVEELEAERETLEAEVERLENELERLGGDTGGAPSQSMSVDQALSGTNLFVRYDRKGEATLEHAHDGAASRADVSDNLRLEHHTTFETGGLAVDGQPYEAFLHDSTEYAFAQWVVTDLLYEIGETGNQSGLAGVFDAIPEIDRVELSGTVGVDTPDGVEQRDFDVIFRDKMGDPLFVADINASRNATTEAMVGSLVENTGTIASNDESLAAGFYVTESFYEPGALETVSEETGGGLLSRSKKLSHVKLSRKRGYHLCLVEARNGEFHLNVPDL